MNEMFITGLRLNDGGQAGEYPFCLPAVRDVGRLSFVHPVTFLVGENGTGKSTLLEAMAAGYGFNPEGGTRNYTFSTRQTHSPLHQWLTLVKGYRRAKDGYFLRAESFYNAATYLEELDEIPAQAPKLSGSYGGKSLHHQSHGESFMALVQNRFGAGGLYILDEPESALSPTRQMSLLAQMHYLAGLGSQFIIATHSPILMAYPNADIFVLSDRGIEKTAYFDTEHYQITRRFLNNPQGMLRHLLDE